MSDQQKAKVVELHTREVDPIASWLDKVRARAATFARGAESAGRIGHAVVRLIDEAGKALKGNGR